MGDPTLRKLSLFLLLIAVSTLSGEALWYRHHDTKLWRSWPHVEARVIGFDHQDSSFGSGTGTRGFDYGPMSRPVYRFQVNGQRHDVAEPDWATDWGGISTGDRVELAVDPSDPVRFVRAPTPFTTGYEVLTFMALVTLGLGGLTLRLSFAPLVEDDGGVGVKGADEPGAPSPSPKPARQSWRGYEQEAPDPKPPLWTWSFYAVALALVFFGVQRDLERRVHWSRWPHVRAKVVRLQSEKPYESTDAMYRPVFQFELAGRIREVQDGWYSRSPSASVGELRELAIAPDASGDFTDGRFDMTDLTLLTFVLTLAGAGAFVRHIVSGSQAE